MGKNNRKETEVIPPVDGWQPHTWYVVDVSYKSGNPVHRSLFYSGFLNGKYDTPGNYNGLVPLNGPDFEEFPKSINQVRYVSVIQKLISENEAQALRRAAGSPLNYRQTYRQESGNFWARLWQSFGNLLARNRQV